MNAPTCSPPASSCGSSSRERSCTARTRKPADLIEQARAAKIPELPSRDLPDEEKLHAIVTRALASNRDERYRDRRRRARAISRSGRRRRSSAANAIKLGDWLAEHFGKELVDQRGARESACEIAGIVTEAHARAPHAGATAHHVQRRRRGGAGVAHAGRLSPPSSMPAPAREADAVGIVVTGVVIVGVIAWLLSR